MLANFCNIDSYFLFKNRKIKMIIKSILKSNQAFILVASLVCVSLFLKAGLLSASVILFCLFCLVNRDQQIIPNAKLRKLLLLPILLFALYVCWTVFSYNTTEAWNIIERKIWLLIIPASFLLTKKTESSQNLHIILFVFLIMCLAASFVCYVNSIINIIAHNSFSVHNDDRTYYYFSYYHLTAPINISPIYLSLYCNLGFVVVLKTPFIKNKVLKNILAAYFVVFILLISAKIGIISLILILALYTYNFESSNLKIRMLIGSGVIIILLIGVSQFSFLKDRFLTSTKYDYKEQYGHAWNSVTYRLAIWSCSLEAIKRKPLLGAGTGGGQASLEKIYAERGFSWGLQESYNPHNEFLSAMLDLGFLGPVVLLIMLGALLHRAIRVKDILLISFIIIMFLFFLTESILLRQKGIIIFCFMYSLFCSCVPDTQQKLLI